MTTCRRPRFEPGQRGGGLGGTSFSSGSARLSAHTGRRAKPGSARLSASASRRRWRANSRDQRGSKLHTACHCCQISSFKNNNPIPTKSCINRTGQLASLTFLHLLSTQLLCLSLFHLAISRSSFGVDPTCLLAQACQRLWLVDSDDVYQQFTSVHHTTLSKHPTALTLAVTTASHDLIAILFG